MDPSALMMVNGLIAIGLSLFVMNIYRKNRKKFYFYWGFGFLLYGVNIALRGIFTAYQAYSGFNMVIVFICYAGGFLLFIAGNGTLINQARMWLIACLSMMVILAIVYLVGGSELTMWAAALMPFLVTSISLLAIRRQYAVPLDVIIIGWFSLFLINLSLPFNLIDPAYVEVLAMFGKIVIFIGIVSPQFTFLEDDMKRFLLSGIPTVYTQEDRGRVYLVNPGKKNRAEELDWINGRIEHSSKTGTKVILVSYYDLIAQSDLDSTGMSSGLFLVKMKPGGKRSVEVFQENTTTMSDDPSNFDLFMSDVINYSTERNVRCDIILYSLSWLVHSYGWKRIYPMFLSLASRLKASQVNLYCIYYPETHPEQVEISVFEKISDRIILI